MSVLLSRLHEDPIIIPPNVCGLQVSRDISRCFGFLVTLIVIRSLDASSRKKELGKITTPQHLVPPEFSSHLGLSSRFSFLLHLSWHCLVLISYINDSLRWVCLLVSCQMEKRLSNIWNHHSACACLLYSSLFKPKTAALLGDQVLARHLFASLTDSSIDSVFT